VRGGDHEEILMSSEVAPAPLENVKLLPAQTHDLQISREELDRLHTLACGRDGGTLLGIAAANALLLHEIAHHLSKLTTKPTNP
jgi:hypothetical protein